MTARYWYDTDDDPDRKRRRQAEFLVHDFFPWELVSYIGVYDRSAIGVYDRSAAQVVGKVLKGDNPKTGIEPGWYY